MFDSLKLLVGFLAFALIFWAAIVGLIASLVWVLNTVL